jgi:hypothetical protein
MDEKIREAFADEDSRAGAVSEAAGALPLLRDRLREDETAKAQFMLVFGEYNTVEWQAAMEAQLLVAERDGPTMFARIGIMRALNRHVERVFDSSRRETHWGPRRLARKQ